MRSKLAVTWTACLFNQVSSPQRDRYTRNSVRFSCTFFYITLPNLVLQVLCSFVSNCKSLRRVHNGIKRQKTKTNKCFIEEGDEALLKMTACWSLHFRYVNDWRNSLKTKTDCWVFGFVLASSSSDPLGTLPSLAASESVYCILSSQPMSFILLANRLTLRVYIQRWTFPTSATHRLDIKIMPDRMCSGDP